MSFAKAVTRGEFSRATIADELYIEIALKGDLAERVCAEAKRLGRRPVDLVAEVIERVFTDNLVSAVLDE